MNDLIGKEILRKCKLIKGQKIKEGSLVKFAKMSKIRTFFVKIGLAIPVVKLCIPENINDVSDWYFMKANNECVKADQIKDIDTSAFSKGDVLYISKSKPGELTTNPNE